MILVSYLKDEHDQLAMLENDLLYDTDLLHMELPSSMSMFLNFWDDNYSLALKIQKAINDKLTAKGKGFSTDDIQLLGPVPFAASCKSYLFKDGKLVYNFLNHHAVQGSGSIMCMPDHFKRLTCTPHIAIVISKLGRNITAEEANEYVGGLMIMNVFGSELTKDVAIATGPYFVTTDELIEFETSAKENHIGKTWNLKMQCSINNEVVSEGNTNDMPFTFAEIIEQASYGVTLYAGDILSYSLSSFLQELKEGDVIETEIEFLGALTNTIEKEDHGFLNTDTSVDD